ncbi:hypothetical protein AJ80_09785 [Polytolypa hystricis UAMH7299]|uniref:EthD domain-containing protein n=1 Tax=Polytolypa hystricis (strain UAMH7299) TaxID=1447883 RepID=A0A2B7WJU8_POLH7|nr:hypothetical protein AJ80_09785 [Polytolypa hystricis UAMH7299]
MSSPQINCTLIPVKRHPSLTEEEFFHHWETVHAPMTAPWAIKHGIDYTLIKTPRAARQIGKQNTDQSSESGTEYDGYALFGFKTIEQFQVAFSDPYFVNVVQPDGKKIFDLSGDVTSGAQFAGVTPIVANGKAVVKAEKEIKAWEEYESKSKK